MSQSSRGFNADEDLNDNERLPLDAEDRGSESLTSPAFQEAKPDSTVADAATTSAALDSAAPEAPEVTPVGVTAPTEEQRATQPTPEEQAQPVTREVGTLPNAEAPIIGHRRYLDPRDEAAAQVRDQQAANFQQRSDERQRNAQVRAINHSDPYLGPDGKWYQQSVDINTGSITETDLMGAGAGKVDRATGDVYLQRPNGVRIIIGKNEQAAQLAQLLTERRRLMAEGTADGKALTVQRAQLADLNQQIKDFGTGVPGRIDNEIASSTAKLALSPDDGTLKARVANAQKAMSVWRSQNPEFGFLQDQRDELRGSVQSRESQVADRESKLRANATNADYVRTSGTLPPIGQDVPTTAGDVPIGQIQQRAAEIVGAQPDLSRLDAMRQAVTEAKTAGAQKVGGVDVGATLKNLEAAKPPAPEPIKAEGAVGSLLRPIESGIIPAAGALGGAMLGGRAGALAGLETGPGAIAIGIAGDIMGGIIGGGLAAKGQEMAMNAIKGGDWSKENEEQIKANMEAHPVASKVGAFVPAILSTLGGGGGAPLRGAVEGWLERTVSSTAANPSYLVKAIAALPVSMTVGARMTGAQATEKAVTNQGSFGDILPEAIKGAATMGPVAFVPAARSVLVTGGVKGPIDAAVLGLSNAFYDKWVRGKEIDATQVAKDIGTDIPGFVIANVLGALMHAPPSVTRSTDPTKPTGAEPPPIPTGGGVDTTVAAKTAADAASKATDLRAKVATSQGAGDAAALGQHLDGLNAAENEAHVNSQTSMLGIPEPVRRKIAGAVAPEIDFDAANEQVDEGPLQHFGLMGIGESVRDAYLPPEREAAIAQLAAKAGADAALTDRHTDQMIALRAVKDLENVLTGGAIEAVKAKALENAGLLQQTPEPDGTTKYRVTDDALPLLAKTLQRAVEVHGEKLAFVRTPGNPANALNLHMKAGMDRLGDLPKVDITPKPDRNFKVRVISRGENAGAKAIDAFDISAPDATQAEQQARTQVESGGRMVVTARAQEVKQAAVAASPVPLEPPQPPKKAPPTSNLNATGMVRREFIHNRDLFEALDIEQPIVDEMAPNALSFKKGKLVMNPKLLAEEEATLGDKTAEWVKQAVAEELDHAIFIKAETNAGNDWRKTGADIWNDPELDPKLKQGASESYANFDQLSDAQKGAEIVRMVLSGRWRGTITEAVFRAVHNFVRYLRGLDIKTQKNPLLRGAVERAESLLEDARSRISQQALSNQPAVGEPADSHEQTAAPKPGENASPDGGLLDGVQQEGRTGAAKGERGDSGSESPGRPAAHDNPGELEPEVSDELAASRVAVPDGVLAHAMREASKELSKDQSDVLDEVRRGGGLKEISDKLGITPAETRVRLDGANAAIEKAQKAAVADLTDHMHQVEPAPLYSLQDKVSAVATKLGKALTSAKTEIKGLKEGFKTAKEQSDFINRQKVEIAGALRRLIIEALPVKERAQLAEAVTSLVAEPVALRADGKNEQRLQTLFKKAVVIGGRVLDKAEDLRKAEIVEGIKKVADRVSDSPGVDVVYQRRIKALIANLDFTKATARTVAGLSGTKEYIEAQNAALTGHAVPDEIVRSLNRLNKLPVRDLPTHVLESVLGDMALLEKLGRLKVKTREAIKEARRETALATMAQSKTTPLNLTPIAKAQPGEELPWKKTVQNWIAKKQNYLRVFDRALLPMAAVADGLGEGKGKYDGPLETKLHGPIDTAYNEILVDKEHILKPVEDLIAKHRLSTQDAEKFAVYATLQQKGGEARLLEQGVTAETIAKNRELSPQLKDVYQQWQKIEQSIFPQVQKTARDEFNQHVEKVDHYFPMLRDRDAFIPNQAPVEVEGGQTISYDPLTMLHALREDFSPVPRKNAESGFSKERVQNAATPIDLDGFNVIRRHVQDAMHFVHMQPVLNDVSRIVADPVFAEKYGDAGQTIYRDYVDTIARQGGVDATRRTAWLDSIRKNLSLGAIGFRLASNIKHASNVPLAMFHIGPGNYTKGLRAALTGEADEWIGRHMAEVKARHGAEPGIEEAESGTTATKFLGKASTAAQKYAFWIARNVDQINARATALGGYMHELEKAGKDPANYLNEPVDRGRVNKALTLMKRAVASANPKDQPQALSRGAGLGDNASIAKTILSFQNVFLDQWSNLRHDFIRAGITERDPGKALAMGAALIATTMLETGIEHGVKSLEAAVTGQKEDEKHKESFAHSLLVNGLRRFPLMGQTIGLVKYGGSGIPAVDAVSEVPKQIYKVASSKAPETKAKAVVATVKTLATLAGVPGAGYAGDLIRKRMPDAPKGH